jgi:hypothetical protein
MSRKVFPGILALFVAVALSSCSGGDGEDADQDDRNLTLPPAESLATDLSDEATAGEDGEGMAQAEPETPAQPEPRRPPRRPTPPPPPTLSAGTQIALIAGDTLTSRHNEVGDVVRAFNVGAIMDENGNEVIPAEAVWVGTIEAIAPSGGENDDGELRIGYTEIEIGDEVIPLNATFVSSVAFVKNRGLGAGDAAKVVGGAVVGGIAGRVLGGNRTGTIVGAVAGAAAGVGLMAATRPEDIILPAGGEVVIQLGDDIIRPRQ